MRQLCFLGIKVQNSPGWCSESKGLWLEQRLPSYLKWDTQLAPSCGDPGAVTHVSTSYICEKVVGATFVSSSTQWACY